MTPFYDFCCFRCVSHCYNSDYADGFGDLDFLQDGDISAIVLISCRLGCL